MNSIMIGERLREARTAQGMSLSDVAGRAEISVATLSRIERDKQTIDLGLFLTLMRILELNAGELLRDGEKELPGNGIDPLVTRITSLATSQRAELWRALSTRVAPAHTANQRRARRDVALQVEELLAQVEYLHNEIEAVRKRLKKK